MKETLEYKGQYGSVEYDEKKKCFYGKILHIGEFWPYEATSEDKLVVAFHQKVEDYLVSREDYDHDFADFE